MRPPGNTPSLQFRLNLPANFELLPCAHPHCRHPFLAYTIARTFTLSSFSPALCCTHVRALRHHRFFRCPPLFRRRRRPLQQVAGDAEVWGDFIVPCTSAHLDGAVNIDLEGIFHSPLGEKLPYFGPWYGSDDAMRRWLPYAVGDWPAAGAVEYVFNSAELTGGAKQQSE